MSYRLFKRKEAAVVRPNLEGRLALALQGGGAFGAFTWGVLDRILEAPDVSANAVSGASAGAINAVLLADGLRERGIDGAREKLSRFWTTIAKDTSSIFLPRASLIDLSSRVLSPYQLNPFNLNPLREALEEAVDFAALRQKSPRKLFISATRVSDGTVRIFREHEVSVDVVLASACLPMLHQAVEIDGESYWDGGYGANPPLLPLIEENDAERLLLVQLIPTSGDDHPTTSSGIIQRLNQITFNTSLQRDLEAIAALQRLTEEGGAKSESARRIKSLIIDHISAEDWYPDLKRQSALNLNRSFITGMHDAGRTAASAWLGVDEPSLPVQAAE